MILAKNYVSVSIIFHIFLLVHSHGQSPENDSEELGSQIEGDDNPEFFGLNDDERNDDELAEKDLLIYIKTDKDKNGSQSRIEKKPVSFNNLDDSSLTNSNIRRYKDYFTSPEREKKKSEDHNSSQVNNSNDFHRDAGNPFELNWSPAINRGSSGDLDKLKGQYYKIFTDYVRALEDYYINTSDESRDGVLEAYKAFVDLYKQIYEVLKKTGQTIPDAILKVLKESKSMRRQYKESIDCTKVNCDNLDTISVQLLPIPWSIAQFLKVKEVLKVYQMTRKVYLTLSVRYKSLRTDVNYVNLMKMYKILVHVFELTMSKFEELKVYENSQGVNENLKVIFLELFQLAKWGYEYKEVRYYKDVLIYLNRKNPFARKSLEQSYSILRQNYEHYRTLYNHILITQPNKIDRDAVFPKLNPPFFGFFEKVVVTETVISAVDSFAIQHDYLLKYYYELLLKYLTSIRTYRPKGGNALTYTGINNYGTLIKIYKTYYSLYVYLYGEGVVEQVDNFPELPKSSFTHTFIRVNFNRVREFSIESAEFKRDLNMYNDLIKLFNSDRRYKILFDLVEILYNKLKASYVYYKFTYEQLPQRIREQQTIIDLPTFDIPKPPAIEIPPDVFEKPSISPQDKRKEIPITLDTVVKEFDINLKMYSFIFNVYNYSEKKSKELNDFGVYLLTNTKRIETYYTELNTIFVNQGLLNYYETSMYKLPCIIDMSQFFPNTYELKPVECIDDKKPTPQPTTPSYWQPITPRSTTEMSRATTHETKTSSYWEPVSLNSTTKTVQTTTSKVISTEQIKPTKMTTMSQPPTETTGPTSTETLLPTIPSSTVMPPYNEQPESEDKYTEFLIEDSLLDDYVYYFEYSKFEFIKLLRYYIVLVEKYDQSPIKVKSQYYYSAAIIYEKLKNVYSTYYTYFIYLRLRNEIDEELQLMPGFNLKHPDHINIDETYQTKNTSRQVIKLIETYNFYLYQYPINENNFHKAVKVYNDDFKNDDCVSNKYKTVLEKYKILLDNYNFLGLYKIKVNSLGLSENSEIFLPKIPKLFVIPPHLIEFFIRPNKDTTALPQEALKYLEEYIITFNNVNVMIMYYNDAYNNYNKDPNLNNYKKLLKIEMYYERLLDDYNYMHDKLSGMDSLKMYFLYENKIPRLRLNYLHPNLIVLLKTLQQNLQDKYYRIIYNHNNLLHNLYELTSEFEFRVKRYQVTLSESYYFYLMNLFRKINETREKVLYSKKNNENEIDLPLPEAIKSLTIVYPPWLRGCLIEIPVQNNNNQILTSSQVDYLTKMNEYHILKYQYDEFKSDESSISLSTDDQQKIDPSDFNRHSDLSRLISEKYLEIKRISKRLLSENLIKADDRCRNTRIIKPWKSSEHKNQHDLQLTLKRYNNLKHLLELYVDLYRARSHLLNIPFLKIRPSNLKSVLKILIDIQNEYLNLNLILIDNDFIQESIEKLPHLSIMWATKSRLYVKDLLYWSNRYTTGLSYRDKLSDEETDRMIKLLKIYKMIFKYYVSLETIRNTASNYGVLETVEKGVGKLLVDSKTWSVLKVKYKELHDSLVEHQVIKPNEDPSLIRITKHKNPFMAGKLNNYIAGDCYGLCFRRRYRTNWDNFWRGWWIRN